MRCHPMVVIGVAGLVAGAGPFAERGSGQALEPTEFLEALAGEWAVVSETKLGPGQEPVRSESRKRARMIGGTWLVAEISGEAGGTPFTSILTLGYDPFRERFVGPRAGSGADWPGSPRRPAAPPTA